jgi:hypothetical protein
MRVFFRRDSGAVVSRRGGTPTVGWLGLPNRIPGSFRTPLLAVGFLAALTVVVFERQLFEGWTFPWDFLGPYTTTPAFVAATIGHGHPLAWSPYVASGFPVDVSPQAGVYYPLWWLLGALRVPLTLQVLTTVQIAHVTFGAVGVLALARARRLAWPWATAAATAYLLFGGFYGQAEHSDVIRGFSYVPWLLWSLTPPSGAQRWTRLAALPLLGWLIAAGAYPGQLVAFGICGLVYLVVALRVGQPGAWRRHRGALILAVGAAAAASVAVVLPYVRAEQAGELYRAAPPTASVRADSSLRPLDVLGLYLNNFAWKYEGTITAWAVGIPILIGVACAKREALRRHAPLLASGTVGLVLAVTPAIGPVGRAMASIGPLFPSRFPASDYKAFAAVALIVLGAEAWGQIAARRDRRPLIAVVAGLGVLVGALAAPTTYAQATTELWLVLVVTVAAVALAVLRPPVAPLAAVLVALVAIDGIRETTDYHHALGLSPWRLPPSQAAFYRARDAYVHDLPRRLTQAATSRPARTPPSAPQYATGTAPDASGWIADSYHLTDYGSTIERVRWQAQHDPAWVAMLLAPWQAYTFSCASGCRSDTVQLPDRATWLPSPNVHTLSYGPQRIVYAVDVPQPAVMVENELAINGWQTNNPQVRTVDAGIPLRAWQLPAGRYQFTASYHEPGRTLQALALAAALAAWLGSALAIRRSGPRHAADCPRGRPGAASRQPGRTEAPTPSRTQDPQIP